VQGIVRNIEGIGIVRFNEKDVVRHPLVQKIVVAYDRFDRQQTAEIEQERA
jgi:phosphate starvation-inducible PhoH-like protein